MPKPFNVVILAAGRGERFLSAGVSVPKPLIEFRGKSLLQHTLDLAEEMGPVRIVVVATDVVAPVAWRALEGTRSLRHVVRVSVTQPGPAASGLLAGAHLPPDVPVVFLDCDNYYPAEARSWVGEMPIDSDFLTVARCPANLLPTNFCCVKVLGERVDEINEKEGFSPAGDWFVGTGVYGFDSFKRFAWLAHPRVTEPGELSISKLLWELANIRALEVEAWLPLGTPEQLAVATTNAPQSPTSNE